VALYYLETSALVKLYVREPGTDRLLTLTSPPGENRLVILSLAQIEFRSAVRRRERSRDIPPRIASQLLDAFRRHVEGRFETLAIDDVLLDISAGLVDRYSLRAFDAIQLAGYLVLRKTARREAPVFVCADRELLAVARREGLPVLDPAS